MKVLWVLLKNYGASLLFLCMSCISLIIAGFMFYKVEGYAHESYLSVKEHDQETDAIEKNKYITIDLSGAVRQPGALRVKNGSRLSEALRLGGGLTPDASKAFVEQNINKAQILSDEQKIYIPTEAEVELQAQQIEGVANQNSTSLQSIGITDVPYLINLNSATSTQLETLSGIGDITAAKIIANRPYSQLEDLVNKKVIHQSLLDKIRAYVTI